MSVSRFAAWQEFHRANPAVFNLFLRFAGEAKAAGRDCFGAHAIGERIRWHHDIETQSIDGLKCNDHHWPYYARLAMLLHPAEFGGFFVTRDQRFDAAPQDILDAHYATCA